MKQKLNKQPLSYKIRQGTRFPIYNNNLNPCSLNYTFIFAKFEVESPGKFVSLSLLLFSDPIKLPPNTLTCI